MIYIKGIASLEGDNLRVFYYVNSGLIREVAFGGRDFIRYTYYCNMSYELNKDGNRVSCKVIHGVYLLKISSDTIFFHFDLNGSSKNLWLTNNNSTIVLQFDPTVDRKN